MEILKRLNNFIKSAAEAGRIPDWLAQEWILILTGIVLLISILTSLWNFIRWLHKWRQRRFLTRDLAPYFTRVDVYKATKNYIPTKCQNVAPSEDEEPGRKYIASVKEKLIPLFINRAFNQSEGDNKYYLILADAGMGKTTFMINLYLSYKRKWFFNRRKYDIKLFPLGNPHVIEDIVSIEDEVKKDTILLLDALDEDAEAVKNYIERIKQIIKEVWRFRAVVITCRTQFFPSREEEPTETGYYKHYGDDGEYRFQKLYVSVFNKKDIRKYLHKRFNRWNFFVWKKLKKARGIAEKSPNLLVRPMLLSHIEELVEGKKEYEWTYEIYEVLIQKWIDREANKPGIRQKFGSIKKFKEELLSFSKSLAVNLYLNQAERGGLFIHKNEKITTESGIQLSDLEESLEITLKESQWRSRSLINRNAEGYYKFSHKSILEYFLAMEAVKNPTFTDELKPNEGLDTVEKFCKEMLYGKILANHFDSVVITTADGNEQPYYHKIAGEKKIRTLKLLSVSGLNLNALKYLDDNFTREIIIVDVVAFPHYYILYYASCYQKLKKLVDEHSMFLSLNEDEWVKAHGVGVMSIELMQNMQELKKSIKILESNFMKELLSKMQKLKLFNPYDKLDRKDRLEFLTIIERVENLKTIDLREILDLQEKLDMFEWLHQKLNFEELLEGLARMDSNIRNEFRGVNWFLKNCTNLEKAMPDVKFYY